MKRCFSPSTASTAKSTARALVASTANRQVAHKDNLVGGTLQKSTAKTTAKGTGLTSGPGAWVAGGLRLGRPSLARRGGRWVEVDYIYPPSTVGYVTIFVTPFRPAATGLTDLLRHSNARGRPHLTYFWVSIRPWPPIQPARSLKVCANLAHPVRHHLTAGGARLLYDQMPNSISAVVEARYVGLTAGATVGATPGCGLGVGGHFRRSPDRRSPAAVCGRELCATAPVRPERRQGAIGPGCPGERPTVGQNRKM